MLAPGSKLGPYEIAGPIGAGGMGEVYRARDTRLGRDVAIKVLPQHLAANPDLRQRFEREARAVSSLNHPHISTLFDVGREGDTDFLVMELMEGETLAARLERGPLPPDLLLRTAIEIADALDRAHHSGIIHRDLKPGNVMMTKGGAKLMDFGLARGAAPAAGPGGSSLSQTPTMSRPLTAEGTILGTFQYMAPEQLEGREADARTDIFALGATLYEMATARKAFAGKSQASLISAIMSSEPPSISSVAPMTPPALERLVRACLAKEPDERIQTAHDVKLQLQWIRDAGSQAGVPAPVAERRKNRERLAWIVASATSLVALLALAFVLPQWLNRPAPPPITRFSVTTPEGVTMAPDVNASAISPDGRKLAFLAADSSGTPLIWIRSLETLVSQPLAGSDNASLPFWSPDSKELGFFADGKLKKVTLAGGSAEVLCEALDGRGATWGRDGTILFVPAAAGSIFRIAADGGDPVEIARPDSTRHETGLRWPRFLPDGKHFTFVSLPQKQGNFDVWLGTLGTKQSKRLFAAASAPVYAQPGYLVFSRNGRLLAQRFDPGRLAIVGAAQQVGESPPPSNTNGAPPASASTTGVLAHLGTGIPNTQLVWLDRAGRPQGTIPLPAGRWGAPSFSLDGQRMVVLRAASPTEADLWMVDLSRAVATRFTFTNAANTGNAVWSPDAQWVAYSSDRGGPMSIYRKSVSGGGEEEALLQSGTLFKNVMDWSRDGRHLVFNEPDPTTGWDIWLLPMDGEHKQMPYLRSRFNENGGWVSPDGRWLAYTSDESGKSEAYVQSFPTPGSKYQVSTAGAFFAGWSSNGKEMMILTLDGVIQVADVETTPTFKLGTPHTLFKARQDVVAWAATPDFSRFLEAVPVGAASATSVTIELNWQSGLKR